MRKVKPFTCCILWPGIVAFEGISAWFSNGTTAMLRGFLLIEEKSVRRWHKGNLETGRFNCTTPPFSFS